MRRHELPDEQWALIADLFPVQPVVSIKFRTLR